MNLKSDFIKKLGFYILIGIIGVVVDTVFSNFFYNLIFKPLFGEGIVSTSTLMQNNPDGHQVFAISATLAALLGGIAGLINNFLLNEFFVYKKEGDKKVVAKRFSKYLITIILGTFFIGKFIIFNFFYTGLNLGFTTSNLIAIAAGTIINYPINYFWTWGDFSFKEKGKKLLKKNK